MVRWANSMKASELVMNASWFQAQLDYHYWANKRLLAVMDSLTPEQYRRDVGSSFPSLQETVVHMLQVEKTWLERLTQRQIPAFGLEELSTIAGVRARLAEFERQYKAALQDWAAEGLAETVNVVTSTGTTFVHPRAEAIQHLVNHGTYHRGQLTTMLRQVGATPVGSDLITYYRERSGQLGSF